MRTLTNSFTLRARKMCTIGRLYLLVWAFFKMVKWLRDSRGQVQLLSLVLQLQAACMDVLVIRNFSANSMTQSCQMLILRRSLRRRSSSATGRKKKIWCVHCVCRSLFFYIVTSEFLSARIFPSYFDFYPARPLHRENLLCGAIMIPVNC